ncbi:MAG: hypothetical protein FWE13_03270 [Firmicutes bacterium]|nr:hypothetical protein [Bacillota bacterium]
MKNRKNKLITICTVFCLIGAILFLVGCGYRMPDELRAPNECPYEQVQTLRDNGWEGISGFYSISETINNRVSNGVTIDSVTFIMSIIRIGVREVEMAVFAYFDTQRNAELFFKNIDIPQFNLKHHTQAERSLSSYQDTHRYKNIIIFWVKISDSNSDHSYDFILSRRHLSIFDFIEETVSIFNK